MPDAIRKSQKSEIVRYRRPMHSSRRTGFVDAPAPGLVSNPPRYKRSSWHWRAKRVDIAFVFFRLAIRKIHWTLFDRSVPGVADSLLTLTQDHRLSCGWPVRRLWANTEAKRVLCVEALRRGVDDVSTAEAQVCSCTSDMLPETEIRGHPRVLRCQRRPQARHWRSECGKDSPDFFPDDGNVERGASRSQDFELPRWQATTGKRWTTGERPG